MDLFANRRIVTVTQLTNLVKGVLEENFEHVWVEGEVSNLSMPGSGHLYFTLKDAGAQVRCVMFRGAVKALKFRPRDGMGLIVRGRITVYPQRGDYQLMVEYLEPQGIGALQLAFSQLKEKLAKEGLFAESHKKQIPQLPQRIGIVTSPTGAAIHDMLHVLNRRYANVEILLYPVRVQGEGSAEEIAEAIHDVNRYRKIDVMIVGRGGGSMEDLWAFNTEVVARAIHRSRIPVISAVGHEVDYTIADLVADLRAPTPSAAAELVVKSKAELTERLDNLQFRLRQGIIRRLADGQAKLNILTGSMRDPTILLGHLEQRIDDLSDRLTYAIRGRLTHNSEHISGLKTHLRLNNPALRVERARETILTLSARSQRAIVRNLDRCRETLSVQASTLHALSPLATLARGYSISRLYPSGSIIRGSAQLNIGDKLEIIFHRGSSVCNVDEIRSALPENE